VQGAGENFWPTLLFQQATAIRQILLRTSNYGIHYCTSRHLANQSDNTRRLEGKTLAAVAAPAVFNCQNYAKAPAKGTLNN